MGWTPSERDQAINRGKSGGKLTDYQKQQLQAAARQAGPVGRDAQEALDKAQR
jgi:hypothetical protein